MKAILLVAISMLTLNASASEESSKQWEAQVKFDRMSATEAMQSNFEKQTMNINIPGTSTWFSPKSLCVAGSEIRTIKPVATCVRWQGRNDDGDVVQFTNLLKAKDVTGERFPDCIESTYAIASSPIRYSATKCSLWSARDDGEVKYYRSYSDADRAGNPTCVERTTSIETIRTTYAVKFFRGETENNRYLGSHTFAVAQCGGDLTPVPAN